MPNAATHASLSTTRAKRVPHKHARVEPKPNDETVSCETIQKATKKKF